MQTILAIATALSLLAGCTSPESGDTRHFDDTSSRIVTTVVDSATPTTLPWDAGDLSTLPPLSSLRPLPGGPSGSAVVTSNNPETFTSTGFLYETARADAVRGGAELPLDGEFGIYLHHDNGTAGDVVVHLLVTNPGTRDLVVTGSGTAWTNAEIPLGQGTGPDFAVAEAALTGAPRTAIPSTAVAPLHAASAWSATLAPGAYVDGRFALSTSLPALVYVVAARTDDVNDAVAVSQTAATGNIDPPGDPPPPFGREAGVYAGDTWTASWTEQVPGAGHYVGYALDTAQGVDFPQDQAFPAISAMDDSSKESVGNYGDTYDLTIDLQSTADASIEVWLASYGGGTPSFWFNGPISVDGTLAAVWLAPDQLSQRIATATGPAVVHVVIPIPGLASIPLALFLVAR